jgi:hypothetical protein
MALAQASGSCLPPDVLQQAGLQLLQALAAPLQQLQLSSEGHAMFMQKMSTELLHEHVSDACHALVTAACGPACHVVGRLQDWSSTAAQSLSRSPQPPECVLLALILHCQTCEQLCMQFVHLHQGFCMVI